MFRVRVLLLRPVVYRGTFIDRGAVVRLDREYAKHARREGACVRRYWWTRT